MTEQRKASIMKRALIIFLLTALTVSALWTPGFTQAPITVAQAQETVTITRSEYERLKQYELLDEVKNYIEAHYYKEPDQQAMMDGAINGLLSGLGDGYTFYYPKEAWENLWKDDLGKYAGIGIQMLGDYRDGSVTITRVFKDTPAEQAGMKKGDVLYKVEDLEVTTATLQDAVSMMRGIPGEEVHVEMIRNGEVVAFDLIKAEIIVNRLESMVLEGYVGYIMLYDFAGDCAPEFEKALHDLLNQGIQSLIIDLRDNPGGWVADGIAIADLFFDSELLFYTEDRSGQQNKTYMTKGKTDIPLVVLVNEHSASTSEIFTAAMKDHGRATVVGTKTFGKGVTQYVVSLSNGESGFQFTNAQYFSPKGNQVHEVGVTPDVEVTMSDSEANNYYEFGDLSDPQLAAAYDEALNLQN